MTFRFQLLSRKLRGDLQPSGLAKAAENMVILTAIEQCEKLEVATNGISICLILMKLYI